MTTILLFILPIWIMNHNCRSSYILICILILEDELLHYTFSGSSFWMFSRRSSSNTALWQIQWSASSIGKSQVLFRCWLFFWWVSYELIAIQFVMSNLFLVFIQVSTISVWCLTTFTCFKWFTFFDKCDHCCCHCRTDITGNKFVRKVYKDIVNLHVCCLLTLQWP
jgi:hypothetical protein